MPGATRPALPALWLALALDTGVTIRDSIPVLKKTTSKQKRYRYVMWIKIPWNCYIPSIIWILFSKSWINHINNIINGQWGFCNIGGNNNFPCSRWRWFKYFGLQKNSWNLPMIIAGHNIKEILGQKLMKSNTSISRIKYFW